MKKITKILISLLILSFLSVSCKNNVENVEPTTSEIISPTKIAEEIPTPVVEEELTKAKVLITIQGGIELYSGEIEFSEPTNVLDALLKFAEEKEISIQMESIGDFSYVSGIGEYRAGDEGAESGWVYIVNGEDLGLPMTEYSVKENDELQYIFVLNFDNFMSGIF